MYAVDADSGRQRRVFEHRPLCDFVSPAVVSGQVYVGNWDEHMRFLPPPVRTAVRQSAQRTAPHTLLATRPNETAGHKLLRTSEAGHCLPGPGTGCADESADWIGRSGLGTRA